MTKDLRAKPYVLTKDLFLEWLFLNEKELYSWQLTDDIFIEYFKTAFELGEVLDVFHISEEQRYTVRRWNIMVGYSIQKQKWMRDFCYCLDNHFGKLIRDNLINEYDKYMKKELILNMLDNIE
jgi:hypothetical protein